MTESTNSSNPSNPSEIKEIYRSWKLENVWETLILPDRDEVTHKTIEGYGVVLNLWRRLTNNPPVGSITRKTIQEFREKLVSTHYRIGKQRRKRSTSTINKIMRELHVIVSPLWPADRTTPDGLGLIDFFKWPKSLKVQKKLPYVYSNKDLSELYRCCHVVKPKIKCRRGGLNCPHLWQLALVLAFNCGARTWDMFGIKWGDVDLTRTKRFKYGCVVFSAQKTLKLHRIPLNRVAYLHLLNAFEVAEKPEATVPVFPDFYLGSSFYKYWKRIVRAANLSMPYGRMARFEDMRKTCVTRHNDVLDRAGFWISGHLDQGVYGSYDNPSKRVVEAIHSIVIPAQFLKAAKMIKELFFSKQQPSEPNNSLSS